MSAPLRVDEKLMVAMASLSSVAPSQWSEFLTALNDYAIGMCVQTAQAAPDKLPQSQGAAQAIMRLHDHATNCRAMFEKLREDKRV